MHITGIIAEYNPFHNGHSYHLKRAKEETGAGYVIIVMSGNFVQRGTPALLDKYARAEMALAEGADLVLELPPVWSTASAEYFAGAGVALLGRLGCVRTLCCGCETVRPGLSAAVCSLTVHETPAYKKLLTDLVKKGYNYAKAGEKAVAALLPDHDPSEIAQLLGNPNNILALEYQKAVMRSCPDMQIHPVERKGRGYHSQDCTGNMASATAIRRLLHETAGNRKRSGACRKRVLENMPPYAGRLLTAWQDAYTLLDEEDCSRMLHYCLLANAAGGFETYADCTPDFSGKIRKHIYEYTGFADFCMRLKSKDITLARIRRILLHILLDIRRDDYVYWRSHSYVPYARILGFRRKSAGLLTIIKKNADIPLLSSAADAERILLNKDSVSFFRKNLFADEVYYGMLAGKISRPVQNEFQRQIVII